MSVGSPWGTVHDGAGGPAGGLVPFGAVGGDVADDQTQALTVGGGIPGGAVLNTKNGCVEGVGQAQDNVLAAIAEPARELARRVYFRSVVSRKGGRIGSHNDVCTRGQGHFRDRETDTLVKPDAGDVEIFDANVLQLDEIQIGANGVMLHQFGNTEVLHDAGRSRAGLDRCVRWMAASIAKPKTMSELPASTW